MCTCAHCAHRFYILGCTNWNPKEKNHRFLTIPINVNLELLEKMFNEYSYHSHGIDFEVNFKIFVFM